MRNALALTFVVLFASSVMAAEAGKSVMATDAPNVAVPEAAPAATPGPMPLAAQAPANSPAVGGIAVNAKLVREGYFQAPQCVSTGGVAFNECLCKSDIYKAEIAGAIPSVVGSVNKQLAMVPEQLATESCPGTTVAKPAAEVNINESSASYQVVYQTPNVLTVLVTYMTYGAGSAHPLSGTEGYTFNLANGQLVSPLDSLAAPQLEKLNQFVQTELLKKYGESLFDETKMRTDPYLSLGVCDSCTLYYTKDGWNVRFQLYAIAPYSSGEPTITIPTDLLASPEPTTSH